MPIRKKRTIYTYVFLSLFRLFCVRAKICADSEQGMSGRIAGETSPRMLGTLYLCGFPPFRFASVFLFSCVFPFFVHICAIVLTLYQHSVLLINNAFSCSFSVFRVHGLSLCDILKIMITYKRANTCIVMVHLTCILSSLLFAEA